MVEHKLKFFHTPMGLTNYPHVLYFKLSNELFKGNELPCRVLSKKIWLLLLIHLKQ